MAVYSASSLCALRMLNFLNIHTQPTDSPVSTTTSMATIMGMTRTSPVFQKQMSLLTVQMQVSAGVASVPRSMLWLARNQLLHQAMVLKMRGWMPVILGSWVWHVMQFWKMLQVPTIRPPSLALTNKPLVRRSLSITWSQQQCTTLSKQTSLKMFLPTNTTTSPSANTSRTFILGWAMVCSVSLGHCSRLILQTYLQTRQRVLACRCIMEQSYLFRVTSLRRGVICWSVKRREQESRPFFQSSTSSWFRAVSQARSDSWILAEVSIWAAYNCDTSVTVLSVMLQKLTPVCSQATAKTRQLMATTVSKLLPPAYPLSFLAFLRPTSIAQALLTKTILAPSFTKYPTSSLAPGSIPSTCTKLELAIYLLVSMVETAA